MPHNTQAKGLTYKDSGVNIDEGNALVSALKPLVQSTFSPQVIGGIGSFAGAYALPSGYKEPVLLAATDGVGTKLKLAIDVQSTFSPQVIGGIGSFAGAYALPSGYKEPVLLAATDGVGTKLKLAIESNKLDSVGIDLVAMCVNDLICNFATPMFFLDYYATGKLDKDAALRVIGGIVAGCKLAECALIGGESAEMPSMYQKGDFDLAGFAVGIAEKSEVESTLNAQAGDVLIGLPSSGLHSNGFSLARALLFDRLAMRFDEKLGDQTLIDILLEPTRIYVKAFKALKPLIHSLAHITGGGIVENLPRALPSHLGARIDTSAIPKQEIFTLLLKHIEREEAYRVFNMGVGMIFAVAQENVAEILAKSDGFVLGEVIESRGITLV